MEEEVRNDENSNKENIDIHPIKEEYAELVHDFSAITRRGIEDFQEKQDGRQLEYGSLNMSGRYGVLVKTDEKGIPTIQLTDVDEDSQGRNRHQRFLMGMRAEASTKDKDYKYTDLLGRLDTVVKEYDVTSKAHDLLKDAVVGAQNKGERKQKDIDENDKRYFSPITVEGQENSLFMGCVEPPDLNLMKSLVVLARQSVKKHLGAKLDKVDVLFYCIWDTMEYADTQGNKVDGAISRVGLTIDVNTKDNNRAFGAIRGAGGGLEILKKYEENKSKSYEEIVKELAEKVAKEASDLDKSQLSSIIGSSCPVIFSSEVTGVFAHEISHTVEGDLVIENKETKSADVNLKSRIGGQVTENQTVSIVDSGLRDITLSDKVIPYAYGTIPIDEHGTLPNNTELVRNGVEVGVLLDRYTFNEIVDGLKEEVATSIKNRGLTGNVRSDTYTKEPLIRMTNTKMLPNPNGVNTVEELARKVPANKKGLYVQSCMGGWIEANTGDFQIIGNLSYLIENGQIVWRKPIKNARISGNITKLNIKEVGGVGTVKRSFSGMCGKRDSWVPTEGVGPAILIEDAKIISGAPRYFTEEYHDYSNQFRKVREGKISKEEVYFSMVGDVVDEKDEVYGDNKSHYSTCMDLVAITSEDEIKILTGRVV